MHMIEKTLAALTTSRRNYRNKQTNKQTNKEINFLGKENWSYLLRSAI